MSDEADFYRLRDPRTLFYGGREAALERPVSVRVGEDAAATRGGQLASLALINMVARVHREIFVEAPSAGLVARAPFAHSSSLRDAMCETAKSINPYIRLRQGERDGVPSLSLGRCLSPQGFHVGAVGATAALSFEPLAFDQDPGAPLGAAMAACLGACALFRLVHDLPIAAGVVSVWEPATPSFVRSGPSDLGALDVGDVAMIGAGALGSSVSYWMHEYGHDGEWESVDRDLVKLHNTNRSLGMAAADAGWSIGAQSTAGFKADVAAALLQGPSSKMWYDEWVDARPDHFPDLVLPLANERLVRRLINRRGEPIILHGTTSRWWQANCHRHIADLDGCVECRLPERSDVELVCSEAPLRSRTAAGSTEQKREPDAALPFLSAAAGLLLVSALYRLQHGDIVSPHNSWEVSFAGAPRISSSRWQCVSGCDCVLTRDVRADLPGRWRNLAERSRDRLAGTIGAAARNNQA